MKTKNKNQAVFLPIICRPLFCIDCSNVIPIFVGECCCTVSDCVLLLHVLCYSPSLNVITICLLYIPHVQVSFDFASSVRVELATSYHNAVCGLCGNMNDDPADDLKLPNGKLAANGNTFGVSQWLEDAPGCSRDCKLKLADGPHCAGIHQTGTSLVNRMPVRHGNHLSSFASARL